MEQYIPKSNLVAEIIHKRKVLEAFIKNFNGISDKVEKAKNKIEALNDELLFIESLEVKEVDNWHLQSKEDIYDVVKDWGLYAFACIMKDGTIQRFNGCLDEDCEGHVHIHIDGLNDDYDNVDDIVYWIEIPTKVQKEK